MDQKYNQKFVSEFSIAHKNSRYNELSQPHFHQDYEIFLNLTEGLITQIGDVTYRMPVGALLLFNNMDLHHNHINEPGQIYDRYVLRFKPEYIRNLSSSHTNLFSCFFFRPFEQSQILNLNQQEQVTLTTMLDALLAISENPAEGLYGQDILVKVRLAEILVYINRLYCQAHQIPPSALSSQYSRIYKLIEYIHENFQDPLPLEFFEKEFFINKYYLCTLFKAVTGTSIKQYIQNCRITRAKSLLMTGHNVDRVCEQVGFHNLSHFSRTFKKAVGESPKQFQVKMRQ